MATMKTKSVGFNIDDVQERQLFDYAVTKQNFSGYVKELIAADIQHKKPAVVKTTGEGVNIRFT